MITKVQGLEVASPVGQHQQVKGHLLSYVSSSRELRNGWFPFTDQNEGSGIISENDSASQGSLHSDQNQTYVVWGATRRGRLPRNARHDEPTGAPLLADRQPIARDGGCAKRAGPGPETCRFVGRGLRLFRRKATFLFGMLLFSFFF